MTDRPPDPELVWTPDGSPRSGRFGDVYFSAEDGLAESRAVFLQGCALPEAWAGRRRFTVGELGFGTGLNVLALLELWRRARPPGGRLHVFSVEAFPMTREEAARAHGRWPELRDVSAPLLERWPARTPGFHRVDLPEFDATLDLAVMEAGEALARWSGRADAWFLDGFSPALNPQMWRDELLAAVAARSAPGARAATFTVAGAVRRGLQAAGFTVDKRPGFGRKRERLEAVFPGDPPHQTAPRVVVVGAGIAGASLARAFSTLGAEPLVLDRAGAGAGASGNPAALVTPRLDAGGGPVADLHAQALERAAALYALEAPAGVIARGVTQLEQTERDARRFDRVAAQPLWPDGAMQRLDAQAASAALGEPVGRGGLLMSQALTVRPGEILCRFLGDAQVVSGEVAAVEASDHGWRLLDPAGALIAEAEVVCLAAGWSPGLAGGAPLSPVRGQASWVEGVDAPPAVAWGGYAAPTGTGLLFGSTHDRGDTGDEPRPQDDRRNLETLAAALPARAARIDPAKVQGRASVRATTPDRLPLAGGLATGLYVLGGLGSRGFATAPLLAEHVAALALGAPSPLPSDLAKAVSPERFQPPGFSAERAGR
ncbi:MAG TPA: FAD-dependent 5-carboxymethylaminomethyl-2-thiouridine(34) oxidoreductase MnmC [Caulobacteraceae bacterium]|nr:FAD-dependent 5-carboxymethylaminomethyl-2-thiouridine(34) oxidoreductase MnmC [Caulobacteraceae bacterium]